MALFNFEHKDRPLASTGRFAGRLIRSLTVSLVVIALALGGGMAGYHYIAGQEWVDAFLNAAMILSGMGPVDRLSEDGAKLFAGGYALFSGLLFVVIAGLVLAPVLHRVLHALHVDD